MIEKSDVKDICFLTPMQEGMLFHYLMDKESPAYFEQTSYRIHGELDYKLFERAFIEIIARHDVLRTIFIHEKVPRPLQVVLKKRSSSLYYEDISSLDEEEKEPAVREFKINDKERGFNLQKDILIRLSILKIADKQYEIIWSFHHIIMDGWCTGILIKEMMLIYNCLMHGETLNLPPAAPFKNYIKWLEEQDKGKAAEHWADYLANYENGAIIPFRRSTDAEERNRYEQEEHRFRISETLTRELERVSNNNNVTINVIFQTMWGVLLQRYNNTKDVVFGAVVSGRPAEVPGIETMVGLFINTIPVRVKNEPGETFEHLLERMQERMVRAKLYEFSPLADIQSKSPLKRELVNHILIFENYPVDTEIENIGRGDIPDFSVEGVEVFEQTNYDLNVIVVLTGDLRINIKYNSLVYNTDMIKKLKMHLSRIIEQVVVIPGIPVDEIEIISPIEKKQLLFDFNRTEAEYPKDKTIHRLFEEQVEKKPHAVAVGGMEEEYPGFAVYFSYKELNRRANRLALLLREKGVNANDIVGLMVERSPTVMIGIMGILKAGGAYLPISPEYPEERVKYMLYDSNAGVLVTQTKFKDKLKFEGETVSLGDEEIYNNKKSTDNLPNVNVCTDTVYVIYTSGTTGKPKGAMIEHTALVNRLNWMQRRYPLTGSDTILQKTSFSFDVSVWELFWWSVVGSKVYFLVPGGEKDPDTIVETIEKNKISIMHFVPSMLNVFLEHLQFTGTAAKLSSLRRVFSSGEALTPAQAETFNRLFYPRARTELVNLYGPTEAAIDVSYFDCFPSAITKYKNIPIGKPIDNIKLYIMDRGCHLQPIGVPGELVISGAGLARGYINNPELTADKFNKSYMSYKSYIFYRTGDQARWLPGGNIEFLGRLDHQVKVRGFRIELGEIENRILNFGEVKEAVVMKKEYESGDGYLCAYIVPRKNFETTELREYLSGKLPDYMIPGQFIELEEMYLTANGKIDRKRLLSIDNGKEINTGYAPPRNETEECLARLWESELELERVGIKDNYFNIGGDSITSIRFVNIMNEKLGTNIKVADLYSNNTIEKLAIKIDADASNRDREKVNGPGDKDDLRQEIFKEFEALEKKIVIDTSGENIEDVYPMSDIEKGMVFHSLRAPGSALYHNQEVFQIKDNEFEAGRLKKAFSLLMRKHSTLRTCFNLYDAGEPVRIVYRQMLPDVEHEDISHLEKAGQEDFIYRFLLEDKKKSFDFGGTGLLWRVRTFARDKGNICFIWISHHSIMDGWSFSSLLTELYNLYFKLKSTPSFIPGSLKNTYKEYVIEQVVEGRDSRAVDYWKKELIGYQKYDFSAVVNNNGNNGGRGEKEIEPGNLGVQLLGKLERTAKNYDTSVKHLCFGAYAYMLSLISCEDDIVVGLLTNNRPQCEDGDKIIGCFLNMVPVRMIVPRNIRWVDYIHMVEKKMRELKKYDKTPLSRIARAIGEKNQNINPIFDTVFNYTDFHIYNKAHWEKAQLEPGENNGGLLSLERTVNANPLFNFCIDITGRSFHIGFYYADTRVRGGLAGDMFTCYRRILDKMVGEPGSIMGKEGLITAGEKHLHDFQAREISRKSWKKYLEFYEEPVSIPGKIEMDRVALALEREETRELNRLPVREQMTLKIVIQAVWGIILSKYNGKNDVVFGKRVPGDLPGEHTIIPVRIRYEEKTTFNELLQKIKSEEIQLNRLPWNAPDTNLFDHILVFDEEPRSGASEAIMEEDNYDFHVIILPGDRVKIILRYNENIYDGNAIGRIADDYVRLLNAFTENLQLRIIDVELESHVSPLKKADIDFEFNI